MQASGLKLYLKRDSVTDVFLWILRNFQQYVFYRTPSGDSFCWFKTWQKLLKVSKWYFRSKWLSFRHYWLNLKQLVLHLSAWKMIFCQNKLTVTKKFFPQSLINPSLIQNPWQILTLDAAWKLVTCHYYAKMRVIWLTTSCDIFTSICCTALLKIVSVNMVKSAVSCGFGHIYRRNP